MPFTRGLDDVRRRTTLACVSLPPEWLGGCWRREFALTLVRVRDAVLERSGRSRPTAPFAKYFRRPSLSPRRHANGSGGEEGGGGQLLLQEIVRRRACHAIMPSRPQRQVKDRPSRLAERRMASLCARAQATQVTCAPSQACLPAGGNLYASPAGDDDDRKCISVHKRTILGRKNTFSFNTHPWRMQPHTYRFIRTDRWKQDASNSYDCHGS